MKKFLASADQHGALRDEATIEKTCEFAKYFRPDYLINLGDTWDFRSLRAGASEEDQAYPLKDDLKCGEDTIERFFSSAPTAFKVHLWGNHSLRRIKRLQESPRAVVAEAADRIYDDIVSCVKRFTDVNLPYNKRTGVFEVEGFRFVHGYAHGIYAARKHAITYGNCMFAHIHCKLVHTLEDLNASTAYCCPCSCDVDQDYNATQITTLRQENGFCYGFLDGDRGFYDIHYAMKRPDGTFFLPTEWNLNRI